MSVIMYFVYSYVRQEGDREAMTRKKKKIQRMPTDTLPGQSHLCDGTLHCSFVGSTSAHREGQTPDVHSPGELHLCRL